VTEIGRTRVSRVAAEGGVFYALGSSGAEGVIWSSSDGVTWDRSDLPFPAASWGNRERDRVSYSAGEIVSVGGRLVVIGSIGIAGLDYAEVVLWASTDGETWTEIPAGTFGADAYTVNDVSNGPGGLVVISERYPEGEDSAWRSTDGGQTWSEHRPRTEGAIFLNAVVGTASGYVAAGAEAPNWPSDPTSPRIWTSADGTNWQASTLEGSGGSGAIGQITVDGSGRWLAVGLLNDDRVVWRSSDGGATWDVTAGLGSVDPGSVDPRQGTSDVLLTAARDGFIGFIGSDPAVTWTSEDGLTWEQASTPAPVAIAAIDEPFYSRGVARIGDSLIVVVQDRGAGFIGSNESAYAWIGSVQR